MADEQEIPYANSLMKLIQFFTDMRKRDLLLIGFVGLFVLLLGALTGVLPSPILTVLAQQNEILQDGRDRKMLEQQLVELGKLQLYLSRENCKHTATTPSDIASCDRQDIRDAILGTTLPSTL